MTRTVLTLGWILVVVDLVGAAVLYFGREGGDAASRGLGTGLGAFLAALALVAAALLFWGGRGEGRQIALVLGSALAAAPVALTIATNLSPQRVLGMLYPSMRPVDRPMQASPQYNYPDSVSREAALALVLQDFGKLDTLLRTTPAPDLTAHDERGQSLLGLATVVALMDGGTVQDLEGLRLLLAAGARPRADDLGSEGSFMELVTRVEGERGHRVLEMLLDAGLAAETPDADGRSPLFFEQLTPDAARLLIARGADPNVHDTRGGADDWSPVTYQADLRRWSTALALLKSGVPQDHGTPPGSVLARIMRNIEPQLSTAQRADSAYRAFITATRP